MQCKCLQSDLAVALRKVDAAVSRKNVIPSLSGVLLETVGKKLRMYATDLEVGVEVFVPAEIATEGRALPLFKVFKGIVTSLPEGEVELVADVGANRLSLEQDRRRYSFDLMDPEAFPPFPDLGGSEAFTLGAADLAWAVRSVSPAADPDPRNGVFSCILMERDRGEGVLRLVASDRMRLAVADVPWAAREDGEAPEKDPLFPAMFSKALVGVLPSSGDGGANVEVRFNDSFTVVRTADGDGFFARLGAGSFPDYRLILPKDAPEPFAVDVGALREALERADLILGEGLVQGESPVVELEMNSGVLTVKSPRDPSLCYEEIAVSGGDAGAVLRTTAKVRFLLDAIRPVGADALVNLPPQTKMVVVRDAERGYTHLVMPVVFHTS